MVETKQQNVRSIGVTGMMVGCALLHVVLGNGFHNNLAVAAERVFYLDSALGDDHNSGDSPSTAWQSLDRLQRVALEPGDTVRFKAGGVWRGSLVPASGEEGRPVTYCSYGQGPKPRLLGSRPRDLPQDWMLVEGKAAQSHQRPGSLNASQSQRPTGADHGQSSGSSPLVGGPAALSHQRPGSLSASQSQRVTGADHGQPSGSSPLVGGPAALWATRPMEYELNQLVLDLRQSEWGRHEEAGAEVQLTQSKGDQGTRVEFICRASGQSPNHIQVWGPDIAVEEGTHLVFTFRARSSKPFRPGAMTLRQSGSPWTSYAESKSLDRDISEQWQTFQVVYQVATTAESARLHMYLGDSLPAGATFEMEPLSLHAATPSVIDPLFVDVGNIIFDGGKVCGWKKWSIDDLANPYDYFYDPASWRVYLKTPENPAKLHDSIELALKRHVVNQGGTHHVIYDGLDVRYGAAHGFGGGGTHHIEIRNCDLSYIGGGHQLTRSDGRPVRYGNAIEFWGNAHDNLVEGCRIWEVYDAALTNQNNAPSVRQENITYRNNVIWNCEYSFEYWNRPESSTTRNIRFINNTCVDAGVVWSHAQRPDPNGSHLMFYTNTADTQRFVVQHNIFCNATQWGSRYSSGWKTLPEMDENLWFSDTGVTTNWFGELIGPFEAYQQRTGLDASSRYADPKFVDPAGRDYRLSPESPARQLGPDGSPVGAGSLY